MSETIIFRDVGVLLVGYSRPDLLKNRIHEFASENIVNLYISIDGGEASHTLEMENFKSLVKQELKSIQNLRIYHEENNLGLVRHLTSRITQVLNEHKYIIVIEDDIKVSKTFFSNMLHGLNYLNARGLKGVVSGWSPVAIPYVQNKWRNSKYPFIWGWASSREVWEGYKYNLSMEDIEKDIKNSVNWSKYSNFQKAFWISKFNGLKKNPLYTWDIQFFYHCLKNNYHCITPLFTMTGNQGFNDERAIHTKGPKPKMVQNNLLNGKKITKKSWFFYPFFDFIDRVYISDMGIISKARSIFSRQKL
jgi:hypothetical protein